MAVCLWASFLSEHLCDSCMNIVSCILLRVSPRSHNRPPFITAASTLNTSSIKTHCLRTYVKIRYVLEYLEGNWIETLSLPTNGLMCDPPGSFIFRTIVTQKIELYCLHVECWAEGDKAPGGGGGSLSECFLLHGDFLSGSTPGWTLESLYFGLPKHWFTSSRSCTEAYPEVII